MTGAVVLLSGGIDSATCLGIAAAEEDEVHPLHLYYGQQTAGIEREMAKRQTFHFASLYEEETEMERMRMIDYTGVFSHFAEGVAESDKEFDHMQEEDGRSSGYVPMRNLHLLATAAGFADHLDLDKIYIGVQGGDEGDYPDCRPGFIRAASTAVTLSLPLGQSIDVTAPLLKRSKADVIELADQHDVRLDWTYSCYSGGDDEGNIGPCGDCPACDERTEAFDEVGIEDPLMT